MDTLHSPWYIKKDQRVHLQFFDLCSEILAVALRKQTHLLSYQFRDKLPMASL